MRRWSRSLDAEAETAKVDRVRQKVYLNSAVISLFAGAPGEVVESRCAKALQHPDRRNPQMTTETVTRIRETAMSPTQIDPELFFKLYSPCSLFYWYQNPLEGLPIDFLSFEAMAKNTNQHFSM